MTLPENVLVRYTEEDAGYISVRPLVKQPFRLHELADLVVRVAGKDAARVQQIFRSGTVVYNGYRYWWDGLSAESGEIEKLLEAFPDDDPTRPFDANAVIAALLEIGGGTQLRVVEISREEASRKKLFGKRSPWEILLASTPAHAPHYEKYSHARHADLFRMALPFEDGQRLVIDIVKDAPREIGRRWSTLLPPAAVVFVCPRK